MKQSVLIPVITFLFMASSIFAQKGKPSTAKKSGKGYEITVSIKGQPDSMLYIANYYGASQYLKDSAFCVKSKPGIYVFKGKEPLLGGIYILATQKKAKLIEIIVDKNQQFMVSTDTVDLINNLKFKNSPENEQFYSYIIPTAKIQGDLSKLQKQLKEAKAAKNEADIQSLETQLKEKSKELEKVTKEFIIKNPEALISKVLKVNEQIEIPELPIKENGNPDSTWGWTYYKTHYWDNVDLLDDRILRTPVFTNKLSTYFTGVLIQDNDSIIKEADLLIERVRPNKEMFKYIVWWITNHYETSKIMGQDAIFVHLAEKYYATNQCWWVSQSTIDNMNKRAAQIKAILIGAKAPELMMPDTNNIFISCYAPKTKYTFLWFWDPDCGHCKIETPKLRDFYNTHKDSLNLEIYAVSTDTDLERWKKYIVENKLVWINVGGNTANLDYRKVFDIFSTPVLYILDEQKKIIAKRLSVDDLPEFFKQYNRMMEHNKK